ncbi:hypothetical protein TNCV_1633961 [Trichonephila clavipes]|nr:hypothetical protein TNCV_1633961 [Trichonephila clavipes]
MVAALLFQKLLSRSNKTLFSPGGKPPYMRGMKKTIVVLFCLGQTVGEMKLLLLGFAQWTYSSSPACEGCKVYPPCSNYNVAQAASVPILACIGCHKSQLLSSSATVLNSLKMRGFMDLI